MNLKCFNENNDFLCKKIELKKYIRKNMGKL